MLPQQYHPRSRPGIRKELSVPLAFVTTVPLTDTENPVMTVAPVFTGHCQLTVTSAVPGKVQLAALKLYIVFGGAEAREHL